MKKIKTIIVILLSLVLTSTMVTADGGEEHWIYDELPDFKQQIHPLFNKALTDAAITQDEWHAVHTQVLNSNSLDLPIYTRDWSTLLKFVLGLSQKQIKENIKMYVDNFDQSGHILREDAVGGMIKLLSFEHINASGNIKDDEPDASKALIDYNKISDKQQSLISMAYRDQILDATVSNQFRPKDKLTNAEAISMLYRVIMVYINEHKTDGGKESLTAWSKNHWSAKEINQFFANAKTTDSLLNTIQNVRGNDITHLDAPITIQSWNDLIKEALNAQKTLGNTNFGNGYVGTSNDGYVKRGNAVATLMKLRSNKMQPATELEEKSAANAFKDLDQSSQRSIIASAYSEGLINGYGNQMFYPGKSLSNGEAVILISRFFFK